MVIRREEAADEGAVRLLIESSFGRRDEAELVDNLRREGAVLLSLVAEVSGEVAGHILFSRMWIENEDGSLPAVALAPVAVMAAHQRQGIGATLVRNGLDRLRERGERIVVVLGRPEYYSRFGFSAEKASALASPFPPEAFMAMELTVNALRAIRGKVRYARAFGLEDSD
jgi:putative acetyltransferase